MHFLSISDLGKERALEVFALADKIIVGNLKEGLIDKTAVLFFPESSIRTRLTFEKGIRQMGGLSIVFPPSALDKREDVRDVARYIENWADIIIVRHQAFEKIRAMSESSRCPVINAMSSSNHPCEILADIYSLSKIRHDFLCLEYTFVGENGNISRSWYEAAKAFGFKLNHVCVSGNEIDQDSENYAFSSDLDEVLRHTDILITDSLPEEYRNAEYYNRYQITRHRMEIAKKNIILNPCPPFYRSEELSDDALCSEYFVGYDFKKHLLEVQQAIMLFCLNEK